jgi:hypothetical protein
MYSFAHDEPYDKAILEAMLEDDSTTRSRETVAQRYRLFREIVEYDFLTRMVDRGKIGGPGKIVQIDEAKVNW